MTNSAEFDPYINGALPLSQQEVDRHIERTPISYYGITPPGVEAIGRNNNEPITWEEDDGEVAYSVLVCGDISNAKRILIKGMSWTDNPGRGFEGLREALIADTDERLAVVGVSFPGAGLNSPHMTPKQKQ